MENNNWIDPRPLFSDPALIDESKLTPKVMEILERIKVKKKTHVVSVSIPVTTTIEYEVHLDEYFGDDWDDEDIRLKAIDVITDREVDMVDKHGGDVLDGDYDHHYASVFLHTADGGGRILGEEE